jgi:hypothetical protein
LPVDVLEYISASLSTYKAIEYFENLKYSFTLTPIEQKAIEFSVCEILDAQYWIDFHMKQGQNEGIPLAELLQIRIGISKNEKTESLINITKSIVQNYRIIDRKLIDKFVAIGFIEAQILEIISLINHQKHLIQLTHLFLLKSKNLNQNEFLNLNK